MVRRTANEVAPGGPLPLLDTDFIDLSPVQRADNRLPAGGAWCDDPVGQRQRWADEL
jgi:hypothetical protein